MLIRGRLAPSPTGAQHLGNARTHLLAYWAARSVGGRLALRIDDLDSPRVKRWASDQAIEDLRWLGICWDGQPAFQSDHVADYQSALGVLAESNRIYPCVCTRRDIDEAVSAPHESRFRGEGPVYPGTCAGWQFGDPLPGGGWCWRFRCEDTELRFSDAALGSISCNPAVELGDFPVTQKNGTAAYQLAVVVDDRLAGVNQVVRGNDLVASTFRQIQIARALDTPIPNYAHVPLVRGPDDRRLAKRHGDTRLSHYRQIGVSSQSIIGWAARSAGLVDSLQPLEADDVIDSFDWQRVVSEDTRIDPDRLFDAGSPG